MTTDYQRYAAHMAMCHRLLAEASRARAEAVRAFASIADSPRSTARDIAFALHSAAHDDATAEAFEAQSRGEDVSFPTYIDFKDAGPASSADTTPAQSQ